MQCEAPDTHFYAEVHDFNIEFLGLVAAGRRQGHGPVFGLDAAVVEQISHFGHAQLESIADTPCLLAGFSAAVARTGDCVAEPLPGSDPEWTEHARLFAAGLLAYTLQASRRDPLRAALCPGYPGPLPPREGSFRDRRRHADRALRHLQARFRGSARFWPDLVRAAREGTPERLALARLTAIQLATAEAGSQQRPAGPAPGLRAESAMARRQHP